MAHPQHKAIEQRAAELLRDDSRSFEVASIDPGREATPEAVTDSVSLLYLVPETYDAGVADGWMPRPEPQSVEDALRNLDDYLALLPDATPHVRVNVGSSEHRRAMAAKLGFILKSRSSRTTWANA